MKSIFEIKILGIVVAVCVAAYMLFSYFMPAEKALDNLTPQDRLNLKKNIVVLGVDERTEEGDVGRSDTLFVVMFDTNKKAASLLSIPRDTRVRIKGHGWDKINHAYAYGGRELTQKTVEELLGIKVNNYVMVDFKGFVGLVDAIGGVDIEVEKNMYYYDDWDGFKIDLKKGMQHMDGKTAIQYVRYRDEEGDIGRIRRQQHFMMAVYDRITSANMLLHIPGLAKQLSSMVKTDLPLKDMVELGRVLHSMVKDKGLAMATVPGTPEYINEISYWLPDIKAMREQMVRMQGATMTDTYRSAAELMAREYKDAVERAEQGDKSAESKDAAKEEKDAKDKQQDAKKDAVAKKLGAKKNAAEKAGVSGGDSAQPVRGGKIVVRLVNCSGSKTAASSAISRLQSAGFTVINGGSGELISQTTVISTTNNGAVVGKLSAVPFAHNLRISRDGAADCDGVVMLGANYK